MNKILLVYKPDDHFLCTPDGELWNKAEDIVKAAQMIDVREETSTWALIEWVRAIACLKGEPGKIVILHAGEEHAVNEYGALVPWPAGLPSNDVGDAAMAILEHATKLRKSRKHN